MSSLGRLKIESEKDLGSNRHGNERKRILQYNERRHMAMRSTSKHQRIITDHIGKPSVLQTRGQSITTTTDYPLPNRNGTSLPNDTVAIAPDRRSIAMGIRSRSDRSGGFSKSLKTKASKLLRREANSTDLTPLRAVDWSEELDESPYEPHATQSTSPQHNLRHKHRGSLSDGTPIRLQISEPFNFQHLTHTERREFEKMQEEPNEDFVSKFSAMRASQAPRRELRGIKAETISRPDLLCDFPPPIPQSPCSSRPSISRRASDSSPIHSLSYSIPNTNQHTSSPVGTIRDQVLHVEQGKESLDPAMPSPLPPYNPFEQSQDSGLEANLPSEDSKSCDVPIATFNGAEYDFSVPHAVTTPDNAAHMLKPPTFEMTRTELSRVVEEDEHSDTKRNSSMSLPRRQFATNPALRHVKSFPNATQSIKQTCIPAAEAYRESVQSSPQKQGRSIKILQPSFDNAVDGIPFQPQHSPRCSSTVEDTDGNWEDLVDWCYDHAAEADCNFDFTRAVSLKQASTIEEPLAISTDFSRPRCTGYKKRSDPPTAEDSGKRSSSVYSTSPRSPLPLQISVPELEPPSAISTQSSFDSASEALTPNQSTIIFPSQLSLSSVPQKFLEYQSPHISNDTTSAAVYEDLCQETYAQESWHYSRPEGSTISSTVRSTISSTISSTSPRSSRSPLSKSSSQESFWNRRHRDANSQSSLPDLMPARLSRDKSEQTADQLAEHMAALGTDDLSSRRRSSNTLVKDVAQKKLLSRMRSGSIDDATNAEVPLPLHPALRGNMGAAPKDAAEHSVPHQLVSAKPARTRMRSVSSATNFNSVKASPHVGRASYGLYPYNGRR